MAIVPLPFMVRVERTRPRSRTFSGRLLLKSFSATRMGQAPSRASSVAAARARGVVLENWNEPVSETMAQ